MKLFGYIFIATIIAKLSSLISFPVITRMLNVADIGELTIWHSIRGIILLAVFLGLPDVVAREAGAHKSQRAFVESLRISFSALAVLAIGMELMIRSAPDLFSIPYPRLLIIAAAVDVIPGLFLGTLPAMGKIRAYAICIVIPALLAATLSAMLVLPPFSMGMVGPLYAHIAASAVNALICIVFFVMYQESPNTPNQKPVTLLKQSLPILGVSLVGISIASIDRYSIRWFNGAESLGYYAVAFQAAALLSFGASAVRTSLVARIIKNVDKKHIISQYCNDYLICGGMFAVLLASLAPEIIRILAGVRYESQVQLVPLLCAAILTLEIYSFGQTLAVARQESQRAFRFILVGAGGAVVLVPLLCYTLGVIGVPIALLIAYALAAGGICMKRVDISTNSMALLCAIGILLIVLAIHFNNTEAIHTTSSVIFRYGLAAISTLLGVLRLRALAWEPKI